MSFAPGDIPVRQQPRDLPCPDRVRGRPGAGRDRLLLRLWMSIPNSRALPRGHEVLWGSIEGGARRGGIGQTAAAPLR
jgi:hypothetical protein